MTIDGKLGSVSRNDERARGAGHSPVIRTAVLKADNGVYPAGMILARDADGKGVPWGVVEDEAIGTGDGSEKSFSGALAEAPVRPGSVVVTDGVETFSDDGFGHLTGDAGGAGTVNYGTGAIAVTFDAAPGDGVSVDATYDLAVKGVLDEEVDTASATAALYIPHGSVRADVLKVGTGGEAPTTEQLAMLEEMGIYPE